uniref:Uncharacterized protein n=2 Tax=Clytia hemisphaerica TaxID=252671 RepID=A0A7M5WY42_9CNID
MKRPSTSSGKTPTKLFRPKKSLPASDTISDTKDVVGYVGCVTPIKVNQSNTREYFTVHIKTSKVDFCRVMVSNHRQLRRVRQDFVNRFHNHEAVTLKKLKPGADILFFNNYSEVLVYDEVMSFQLNDADRVPVADIDDQGLVLSMFGKFKFCGEVKNKPYNKADERQRVDRLLN